MSERRTDETESGSWPTAKASDGREKGTGGSADRGLDAMARAGLMSWSTPTAADIQGGRKHRSGKRRDELLLNGQVARWPTANARDWKDSGPTQGARHSPNLGTVVQQDWTTPTRDDAGGRMTRYAQGGTSLSAQTLCPTATATDAKASGAAGYSTASGRHSGTTLTDATCGPRGPESRSTSGKSRARLNHRWVAQLMGFPADWLDDIAATP